ncbi:unnamed protein product, partial [Mesorhabditis belari]|uniref:Mitochondrial ribosomal protein L1 n=1 Tax=Mesorhabditis belari TaxID=2138241 RepID=A0AAF3FQW9_9BILA
MFLAKINGFTPWGNILRTTSAEIVQIRGRKRALKQTLTRQQKLDRRLKREAKEAARKQYTFMERINIRRMKNLLSPSEQFPGRLNLEEEAALPDSPTTNVYIRSTFKTQYYSVPEALAMHRELQHPSIYNRPDAPLKLRIELNMTTEKQTKMVSNSDEIVPVPYPFQHREKRTILAFVNDPKLQELAVESGAELAVGPDIIKKVIKGQFRMDDYDFCVAHTDMSSHILPLRGLLRTKFPTKKNGGLGDELPEIIERFRSGVKLGIKGDPVHPIWGLSDPIVGRLSMPDDQIEANVGAIIEALCANRSAALGSFVNRCLMMTIPGDAHFALDVKKWLPIPSEEELEKMDSRRGGKKHKKKEESAKDRGDAKSDLPVDDEARKQAASG